MNPALNENTSETTKKRRSHRSRNHRKPRHEGQGHQVSIDLDLLQQRAGNPLWNALHNALVSEHSDEGVLVRISVPEMAEPIVALVPKTELVGLPEIGSTLSVYLEDPPQQNEGGTPTLPKASLAKAREIAEMIVAADAAQNRTEVQGFVIGSIKGGFSVALLANSREDAEKGAGLRAFLPASQASLSLGGGYFAFSDREPYAFTIKEFEARSGNIIVSRRSILAKEKKAAEKLFFEEAKEGDVVSGTVQSIVNYGAFVEVQGVLGLLHISDMTWDKQPHVQNIVQLGQTLQLKIIELDKKAKKLKLGLKQLMPDPWQSIKSQFGPGMDVEGDVVAIADFGVFVHLAEGIEGLIHLSEMSWQRIKHPSHRFRIGDRVKVRILGLDQDGHRISLSTKALEENPIDKLAGKFPVGAVLKTHIVGIRDYGVLVELDENVSGLVHIGELSWTKRVEHPSELFEDGQEVEIVVLGFDPERQRVSCSIKRTQEDPWVRWRRDYAKGTRHEVTVKKVINQGVECELEPGLIGFCPSRELAEEGVARAQEAAKVGQKLNVEVIHCEPKEHRISLSVRARALKETKEDYQTYLKKQSNEGNARTTLGDAFNEAKTRDSHE